MTAALIPSHLSPAFVWTEEQRQANFPGSGVACVVVLGVLHGCKEAAELVGRVQQNTGNFTTQAARCDTLMAFSRSFEGLYSDVSAAPTVAVIFVRLLHGIRCNTLDRGQW